MRTTLGIIIIVQFAVILFLRECSPEKVCMPVSVIERTDTVPGDPVPVPYPVRVPIPADTVYVPFSHIVDTAAILRDYFATRFYSDTIRNDSSFLVIINDSVSHNRITYRQPYIQNLRPTAINTTIINTNPPRTKVYVTGFIGGNKEKFGAGAGALLINKKDNGYGYQYDALNDMHYLAMHFKISLRKNK